MSCPKTLLTTEYRLLWSDSIEITNQLLSNICSWVRVFNWNDKLRASLDTLHQSHHLLLLFFTENTVLVFVLMLCYRIMHIIWEGKESALNNLNQIILAFKSAHTPAEVVWNERNERKPKLLIICGDKKCMRTVHFIIMLQHILKNT